MLRARGCYDGWQAVESRGALPPLHPPAPAEGLPPLRGAFFSRCAGSSARGLHLGAARAAASCFCAAEQKGMQRLQMNKRALPCTDGATFVSAARALLLAAGALIETDDGVDGVMNEDGEL